MQVQIYEMYNWKTIHQNMSYDRYYSNEKVKFQRRLTLRNINLLNKFYTDKHQAYLIHYVKQEC